MASREVLKIMDWNRLKGFIFSSDTQGVVYIDDATITFIKTATEWEVTGGSAEQQSLTLLFLGEWLP